MHFPSLHGPALIAPDWEPAAMDAHTRLRAQADLPTGAVALTFNGGGHALYPVVDGVAVVQVAGLLVNKLGWMGCGWVTGYDVLRVQLAAAFGDADVRAVVLDINSGGGEVAGLFDLVEWIVDARQAAGKPVAAILSECAYSAAYALASSADSIAVPQTGGVGSIGAMCVHWDLSRALDAAGMTPTLIHAGAEKVAGNPYQPLPEAVRARWTAELAEVRTLFAQTVSRNRQLAGVNLTTQQALDTEARCFSGPRQLAEAVTLGLADAIAAPDRAFAAFVNMIKERN